MSLLPSKTTLAKIGGFLSRLPNNIDKAKNAIATVQDITGALKKSGTSALPNVGTAVANVNDAAKSITNTQKYVIIGGVLLVIILAVLIMRKG